MFKSIALTNCGETLRCDDFNAQTRNGVCVSGTCQGCPLVTTACDSGTWDMSIGQCSATSPPDGTTSDSETTDIFGATLHLNALYPPKSVTQLMWKILHFHWSSCKASRSSPDSFTKLSGATTSTCRRRITSVTRGHARGVQWVMTVLSPLGRSML